MMRTGQKHSGRCQTKVVRKVAQLSNENGQRYFPPDLEMGDAATAEDSSVKHAYVEHVECLWQASNMDGEKNRRETITSTLDEFPSAKSIAVD